MKPSFVAVIWLTVLIAVTALLVIGQVFRRDPWWLFRRKPRNRLAWVFTTLIGLIYLDAAWNSTGHVTCDFACQWLIGRMFFLGQAEDLYVVGHEKTILAQGYNGQDWEKMVRDILQKGRASIADEEIEGPLYPPTHGLLMMPFAMLDPRAAYAVLTLIYVQLVFLCGYLIRDITQARIQAGEAALLCMVFPNFAGGIVLGQNSSLTLTVILAGWWLWTRRRPWLAGMVWGLLAYKPVFAVALLWVPVVLLNWRFLAGMMASGAGFVAATLPFTGLAPWLRWLQVGRHGAELYATDPNWVWMSRDLIGLPRRQLWDWEHFWEHLQLVMGQRDFDPETMQGVLTDPFATWVGVSLWLGVLVATAAGFVLLRWLSRARSGFGDIPSFGFLPAFLLFGALLTPYHFMHYDLQPLALPMCLLLAVSDQLGRLARLVLVGIHLVLVHCHMDLSMGHGSIRIPFETLLLVGVWGWTGCLTVGGVLRGLAKPAWQQPVSIGDRRDGVPGGSDHAAAGTFSSCGTSEHRGSEND